MSCHKPAYPSYVHLLRCMSVLRGRLARGCRPFEPGNTKKKGIAMAKRQRSQTTRFELRCSPEELAAWRRAAEECGVSLARYIRMHLYRNDLKLPASGKNYPELPGITRFYLKLPEFTRPEIRPVADPAGGSHRQQFESNCFLVQRT